MDNNIKYNNLKNIIGKGKKTPEEKAAIAKLEADEKLIRSKYANILVKAGFMNKVNIMVKKIMEKELDIDYVIILFGQLKEIYSLEFRSNVIHDILLIHKSSNPKFKNRLVFLIQMNNSDLIDFSTLNYYHDLNYIDLYFNMPDLIFEILKEILILNQNKKIDLYSLLNDLNSIIKNIS
jgi:hypothetical protein